MFSSVLLPLDRSVLAECVLPHAVAVARALDAHITVLHVVPLPEAGDRQDPVDPLQWRVGRAEAETYVQGVQSRLADAEMSVDAEVVEGRAAKQIVKFAQEREAGLTLMSSHGQTLTLIDDSGFHEVDIQLHGTEQYSVRVGRDLPES